MSDNVANLGFAVDSKPLDDAKQKLGDVTTQAQKTEAQANKTSDALNKMGAGPASGGIAKTAQSVEQLAASLIKATDATGKALSVTAQIEQIVAKTGVSYAAANAAVKAAVDAHSSSAAAATKHSEALSNVATQATRAAPAINAVATSVTAASTSFGGSSLNLAAFGTAAVGAATAITRAGDEVYRAQARFSALTGSARDGAAIFDLVKRSVSSTGVEFGTFSSAIEKAAFGVDKLNNSWPVISLNSNKVSNDIAGLNAMFTTMAKVMQTAGATAEEESQALGALGAGIGKAGGLTASTFERILDLSPSLARAISNAFGYRSIADFQAALTNAIIPVRDLEQAMSRIAPWADRNFDPSKPKTFEQATRGVVAAWNELLQTMAQTGAFEGVKTALTTISQILRQDAQDAAALASAIKAAASAAGQGINAATNSGSSGFGSDISGGAGIPSTSSTDYTSSPYSYDNSSYINSSVADGFLGSQDYSAGNPAGDLPGFATGGSFVVGGSGGTDSQLVQFMATPGEMVTIDPNGSATSSISNLMPASDQPDIATLLANQTKAIVDAITALNTATKAASNGAASASSSALGDPGLAKMGIYGVDLGSLDILMLKAFGITRGGGLAGGGGGGGSSSKSKSQDQSSQQQNSAPQLSPAVSQLSPWASWGTATPIKGYQGNSFAAGQPLNPDGTPASGIGGSSPRDFSGSLSGRSPENERMSGLDNVYTKDQYSSYMDQQLTDLKRDFDSQAALNENIGQQNGGVKTARDYGSPNGVSTNYPPAVLGHYDENMAFVPDNPRNVGPGMMPKSNDYTFAGQKNPFPYQPGISTPLSFPSYLDKMQQGAADRIPLPQPRPADADKMQSAIKDSTDATKTAGEDTISKIGQTSSDQVSAIDSSGQAVSDAVKTSGASTSQAFSDGLASLGSEIASALASIGNEGGAGGGSRGGSFGGGSIGGNGFAGRIAGAGGGGSRGSSFGGGSKGSGGAGGDYYSPDYGDEYGPDYGVPGGSYDLSGYETGDAFVGTPGDGSAPFDSGAPGYNDYGLSDYGLSGGYSNNDLGVGGSSVGDVASQYMNSGGADYTSSAGFSDYFSGGSSSSSGFNPEVMNYGGGSYDAGYFAKGGQFVVPGSGDGDHSLVQIHATPGELVTITPKHLTTPASIPVSPLMLNPSANDNSGASQQQAAPTPVETKVVNMYLHPGIQAEQILRSRAQIARAI
ncbi:hypothetical protein J2R96_008385 [Bradyrhizobium elkanii]|nr:hypothetical protein [Bradyrhizobium elkanii]